MRSFKDITADEEAHALALHKEAVVIDASLVGYTDYVREDLWVDDLLGARATTGTRQATAAARKNRRASATTGSIWWRR